MRKGAFNDFPNSTSFRLASLVDGEKSSLILISVFFNLARSRKIAVFVLKDDNLTIIGLFLSLTNVPMRCALSISQEET